MIYKKYTFKSFKQSFIKGYGIETDIHATKDDEFICFHDFTLNRIFKKRISVKNIKYSQIKKISVQNKRPIPLIMLFLSFDFRDFFFFVIT